MMGINLTSPPSDIRATKELVSKVNTKRSVKYTALKTMNVLKPAQLRDTKRAFGKNFKQAADELFGSRWLFISSPL